MSITIPSYYMNLLLIFLFFISFPENSKAEGIDINIDSGQDGIAYIKATYTLSKLKTCNLSKQQQNDYSNSIASINAQDDVLIKKSFELANQPCTVLLSLFDDLIQIQDQIFERYPIKNKYEKNKSYNNQNIILNENSNTKTPKGDIAILNLSTASVICAAVRSVNPDAIKGDSKLYFTDAVSLYAYFHNFDLDKSNKHQLGYYQIITGEPAIKAQSLNSISGAQNYVDQYLIKTDATNCQEIHSKANYILNKYGLHL